jgi:hypothetical protein
MGTAGLTDSVLVTFKFSSDAERVCMQHVRLADERWRDALDASCEAPPDRAFALRVRAIANAAEQEAAALRGADLAALAFRPFPGAAGHAALL